MKNFTFALMVTVSIFAFAFLGACQFHNDEPPEAPAGLTASALSSTSIAVSWNSVNGAVKYKIYRSPNDGAYLEIGESTTLFYTDINLTPATSYYYTITAIDDSGNESGKSKANGTATKSNDNSLSAPTGVVASALSTSSIAVSWNRVSGAVKYKIYRSSSSDGAYLEIGESTTLSYTDTVSPGTYYYKVTAIDVGGTESSKSVAGDAATNGNLTLSAPTGVAASALSTSSIAVSWNNVSGAVKYKIYRSVTLDGAYLEIGESTTLSYTNTGLTPATSYYYKITALDVDGNESSKSTAGDAATKSNDSSLSAPTGLVASALSTSSIAISWNNVSGAAKYKIYRSPNDGAYLEIGESATLSYTNTGLTPVMSYYYKVTAIDASGNESSKSGSASATTKSATENKPSTPLGVTATAESSSSISVSWNVVTGASTYKVYRSTNSSGVYVGIGETPDTGYIDTGLQAATKYYYEVSAVDSSGLESDKSLWDDATTKSATSSTLPAPSGIAATAESSSSINISWNAVTGASKYKVYRSTSLSGAYMGIGETTDTWYTDTGLQAATAYYYEVSAVDSSGIESDKAGPRYVQTK